RDAALRDELTQRFRARGRADAEPGWFHCGGCRGDRTECWTGECQFRRCCVEERGLQYCSECPEFACARLEEWAAKSSRYASALERLRGMAAAARAAR
ncbi:MAG: DUF3795 domain-containing protein, partial [Anaerolineae bacterium]|nr:DUF3795 domain-containing protein [Anaerolineae bacterium]